MRLRTADHDQKITMRFSCGRKAEATVLSFYKMGEYSVKNYLWFVLFFILCLVPIVDGSEPLLDDNYFYSTQNRQSLIDFAVINRDGCINGVLNMPFSKPDLNRVYLDCDAELDKNKTDTLILDMESSDSRASIAMVTIYLRSGKGWFVLRGQAYSMIIPGRFRAVVPLSSISKSTYEPPESEKIDGVRISINRPANFDFKLKLLGLYALEKNDQVLVMTAGAKWYQMLSIGTMPNDNVLQVRRQRFHQLMPLLRAKGFSESEVADILAGKKTIQQTKAFITALDNVRPQLDLEYAKTIHSKDIEARFVWESTGTGIYPGNWDKTMKLLADRGFNGIIPIMSWGGAALYPSQYLPKHPLCERYGDQLEQAVRAAKKYGIELHPRRICFQLMNSSPEFIAKMRKEQRIQLDYKGKELALLCPSSQENRDLEVNVLLEIASKYKVNGIHYDFIRFQGTAGCFCPRCQKLFHEYYEKQIGKKLVGSLYAAVQNNKQTRALFNRWRCSLITSVVREVRRKIDAQCPETVIGADVFESYPRCIDSVAQDWGLWLKNGYLDFVCPMNYTSSNSAFVEKGTRQKAYIKDDRTRWFPGIGLNSTGALLEETRSLSLTQIVLARQLGANGFSIFNLTEKTASALDLYHAGPTRTKAAMPNLHKGR